SALAEGSITLPKGAVESLPGANVIRFHVEHAPIQKSPAAGRPFFDQLVDARIDSLHWKGGGKLRERGDARSSYPSKSLPFEVFDPDVDQQRTALEFSADAEPRLAAFHHGIQTGRAKGAPAAEEKNGLKKAGLT